VPSNPGEACYIPLAHIGRLGRRSVRLRRLSRGRSDREEALAAAEAGAGGPAVLKIGQNMKYDAKVLARYGIAIAPIDDTMLMSYALNSGCTATGWTRSAERYLATRRSRSRS
jgi:DNA polymerase-1